MAKSRVAVTIQILQSEILSPAIGGISPHPVPAKAVKPYVTVRELLAIDLESLSGRSNLIRTIHQIECWDEDYETAALLREAIKIKMFSVSGPFDTWGIDGSVNHVVDAELYDGIRELHQLITRLQIWWYILDVPTLVYDFPAIPDWRMLPVYDVAVAGSGIEFLDQSSVREFPVSSPDKA